MALGIGIVVVVVVGLAWIHISNNLVRLKNQIEEASASLDVVLKKRYDLVPNLVETVKGYAKHEQSTLQAVVDARNKALSGGTIEEKDEANKALSGALGRLFALSEAYPELKANTSFLDLQKQLSSLEEDIAQSRKYYNAVVRTMNDMIGVFPTSLVARAGHYQKYPYLSVEAQARENVQVKF